MQVDVMTETVILRPRSEVAEYSGDPANAPEWYRNIESIEWKTAPELSPGSRVAFVAHFLGRRLEYVYEIVEFVRGEHLVMRTAAGPFPMETSYTWETTASGNTLMRLRNRGLPTGFSKIAAPFIARAMRRANRGDLAMLKEILEKRMQRSGS